MAQVGGAGGKKGRIASLAKSNAKAVCTPKKPRENARNHAAWAQHNSPARQARTAALETRGVLAIAPDGKRTFVARTQAYYYRDYISRFPLLTI